jgi:metal-sulfur cluster biosynthetic enzyme
MKILKKQIMNKLLEVLDPELGISIVDMGLIYDVSIHTNSVKILMTLTTIGCPLISVIEQDVKNKIQELGIKEKDIKVEITFDPPWTIEKMSKKAKKRLGI